MKELHFIILKCIIIIVVVMVSLHLCCDMYDYHCRSHGYDAFMFLLQRRLFDMYHLHCGCHGYDVFMLLL